MESISKYNFHGIEYVELSELNDFLKQMHRNYDDQKVGYIIPEEDKRVAAHGALYHLSAILNKERNRWGMHEQIEKVRKEREAKEEAQRKANRENNKAEAVQSAEKAIERTKGVIERAEKAVDELKAEMCKEDAKKRARIPARYSVWHRGDDEETTRDSFGFVRFVNGIPMFSNRPCAVMWFVSKGAAENVAERLGEGFEVVDMWPVMTKEERLLRAIFAEEDDDGEEDEPCEWHGDGTKAEDEDWDADN